MLSWGVRGASRKGFKYQLKNLVITHKPDIIILTETKVNTHRA